MNSLSDPELMQIVALSEPDGPNEAESLAWDLLVERGYSEGFIARESERIRNEETPERFLGFGTLGP